MQNQTYSIYSSGKFITSDQILEVRNPFDGSLVATTYLADEAILNEAIEKALTVKEELKSLSSLKKFSVLKQIAETIITNREHLAKILCLESGKPMKYALVEIDRSAQTFLIAAEESKRIPKEYVSLDWTPTGEGKERIVNYFPVGLIKGRNACN